MATVWRLIRRFFQIYLAYFLLISAIVVAAFGVQSGIGGAVLGLLAALLLLALAARVAGVRWPKR